MKTVMKRRKMRKSKRESFRHSGVVYSRLVGKERALDHGKDFCGSLGLTVPIKDGDVLFRSLLGHCCLFFGQRP